METLSLLCETSVLQLEQLSTKIGVQMESDHRLLELTGPASAVLKCCSEMLSIFRRYQAYHDRFSASVSYYLHAQLNELDSAMQATERCGTEVFEAFGPGQSLACDLREYFLHRLREEERSEREDLLPGNEWANDRNGTNGMIFASFIFQSRCCSCSRN